MFEQNVSPYDYLRPPAWSRQLVIGKHILGISLRKRDMLPIHSSKPSLYNRLSILRVERGLTRQALACLLGISDQTLLSLESSDYIPSLELALRISDFFGMPIEAIFSRT